ncbi:MAG: sigma factor-like helix-turn-helix DNA-binding protein, partial [Erythrobacter sp.]|nr:sigma factor-like helix-turn-helix DNA-binding protein [Erythrobacter sp.]
MNRLGEAIAASRPRVIAALAVHCRDLDLAEEAFAEASARCLGMSEPPRDVAAWLMTVSKRRIIDTLRRRAVEARAIADAAREHDMAEILTLPEPIPDERLRLLFICCHPALALEARAALALKVICGLSVSQIARVFFASEPAMLQRITRAKRKVREAGIAFELPPRSAWGERLEAVLLTLELACTAAYQDAAGERTRIDGARASQEVARLAAMVADLLPSEPEALGLAA